MGNPYLTRQKKLPNNKHGIKSEENLSKRIKAQLIPASGAMEHAKGDMSKGPFLIESKATIKDSMSLQYGWWNKISAEAREKDKFPALAIQFVNPDGSLRKHGGLIAVPEYVFEAMLDEISKKVL